MSKHTQNQPANFITRLIVAGVATALLLMSAVSAAERVKLKKLPKKLTKDGLVVMQLGPLPRWQEAQLRYSNGRKGKAHDGFFVDKLRPGKYTIKTAKMLAGTTSTVLETALVYDILTINRTFEIEAGKVTHLGLQYFLPDPKNEHGDAKRTYLTLSLEHQGPEQAYLAEYYPKLAATLTEDDVITAPHSYANDKLSGIRKLLLTVYAKAALNAHKEDRIRKGLRSALPVEVTESNYIVGDLGLLARANLQTGKLDIIETNTVSRIAQLPFSDPQPWFLTKSGALSRLNGRALTPVASMPANFMADNGALLGPDRLVLADRRFNFATTLDGGSTWKRHADSGLSSKQFVHAHFEQSKNKVFAMVTDNAFLFKKSAAAMINKQTGAISSLDLPTKVKKGMQTVFVTDQGMFIQSQRGFAEPTQLHFLRQGSKDWLSNTVLNYFGCKLSLPTNQANDVRALCGTNKHPAYLQSTDYGQSWQRYQPAASDG